MRYIVNADSHVIHAKEMARERCNLDDARKDRLKEVGLREFMLLLHEGFVPCAWCMGDGDGDSDRD